MDVEHECAVGFDHLDQRFVEVALVPNALALHAETLRDGHEVRVRFHVVARTEVRLGAVATEEAIFPLHHHPEVLIVQNHHLCGDLFGVASRQFLNVHEETAVAVDVDDEVIGVRDFGPHRGGQAEAHRAEAAAGHPLARLVEREVLRRPHLVLTDAGADDRLVELTSLFQQLVQPLDRVLRDDQILAGFGERQRFGFAPRVDLAEPFGVAATTDEVGVRVVFQHRVDVFECHLHVAVDRNVREFVLVNLALIDVDVDDFAVLGELGQLAGHAVVEAHAERDEQVGIVDGVVAVDGAVHPEHVQTEVIIVREIPEAVERERDGDAQQFGELRHRVGGSAMRHAAARVNHRPLAGADRIDDRLEFVGLRTANRAIAGQVHRRVPVGNDLLHLHVFTDVDQDRSRSARRRNVKRFLHHPRQVFGARDEVVVLRDAAADFHHRRFLKRIVTQRGRTHLPRDRDHRDRVHLRVGNARDEVGRAGAAGAEANARLAGGARVAVRHESAALFVAREDGAEFVGHLGEGLVNRHRRAAGIGEYDVDTVPDEALNEDVGPAHFGRGRRDRVSCFAHDTHLKRQSERRQDNR